jgi:fatty-acyl-CoA synthase
VFTAAAAAAAVSFRLSDADIAYIAAHGDDKFIMVDLTFLPILGRIWQQLPNLQGVIVLTDR